MLQTLKKNQYNDFILKTKARIIFLPTKAIELANYFYKYPDKENTVIAQKVLGKDYSDNYYRKLQSQISKAIEQYWKVVHSLENPLTNTILEKLYQQQNTELIPLLLESQDKEYTPIDTYTNFESYLVKKSILQWLEIQQHSSTNNLIEAEYRLELFYAVEKLQLFIVQASHKNIFENESNLENQTYIENFCTNNKGKNATLDILYLTYQLLLYPSETIFDELVVVVQNPLTIPTDLVRNSILIAINFCIKQINSKNQKYIPIAFHLYKSSWESKLIVDATHLLTPFSYSNTIAIALKMQEYTWAKNFILDANTYLPTAYQETYLIYNQAKLYYEIKDYTQAKKAIIKTDFDDDLMSLNTKCLLVKIYYELEEWNSLEYLLESFYSFIKRKKIQSFYKEYFGNFVKYMKKITMAIPTQKIALSTKIKNTKTIASKDWLLHILENKIFVER